MSMTLLTIAGGVALILFGVRYLRKGLDRLFGARLGKWLQRLAGSRVRAFFTGLGVSLLAPSSTTMSVLAVQTVQAKHLSARQMLALIFGADIGLTILVLLSVLGIEQFAPVLILIGVILYQFTQATRSRGIGQVVLSLGFIFFGIATIKSGASAFGPGGDLEKLMEIAQGYPVGIAVMGALMAVALQSSTATILLAVGLVSIINLQLAVAVVTGANVGIALTMLIVGWPQLESRRLAMGNLLTKAAVAVIFLSAIPVVVRVLEEIPGEFEKKIGYAHTGFNIIVAMLGLPLVRPISALVEQMLPAPPPTEQPTFGPRYIHEGPIDSLSLALGQSLREIMRVAEIVRGMYRDLWRALENNDEDLARKVSDRDDQVDLLDMEIKRFLTRLASQESDHHEADEQMRQLRYLTELETIGDIIDKNLSELVLKRARKGVTFSKDGWRELIDFSQKVAENMLIAETAFATRDRLLAQQLLRHKERLNVYERELRDRHFTRLNAGLIESRETSAIHLDLLTNLRRINSHVTHVAYAILQDRDQPSPTPQ